MCEENLYQITFDELTDKGMYYIQSENGEKSYQFKVEDNAYDDVHNAMLKALYYLRCGCGLEEKHAGRFVHKVCHNKPVFVYENPSESFNATGGWHDAGDYGRYVTPGAVTVAHLLYAYTLYPDAFKAEVNIPESGNGIPDVLNESRYELEWLLKMQRKDGAVYHKLTSKQHAPFIMPEDDLWDFYALPVSSLATADFCAVMALATRVYHEIDAEFAGKMEKAAILAWNWLAENKEPLLFTNPEDCGTGEYGDDCDEDERLWAATEMYYLAKFRNDEKVEDYVAEIEEMLKRNLSLIDFGWVDVSGLASLAILTNSEQFERKDIYDTFYQKVMQEADRLVEVSKNNGFSIGMEEADFVWGSNMVLTNRGILMALAYWLTKEDCYKEVVLSHLDYLLGLNITNYSFVTCYGEGAYRNPHFRPMVADGIDDVLPGMVSGGPNGKPCDEKAIELIPAGTPPMKCFADHVDCYSLNEITIYWNSSPLVMTAFLLHEC